MITDTAVRPFIVLWFLFVCPGMALVNLFRPDEPVVEWVLVLALSSAIAAIVAGILLFGGRWSPIGVMSIVIGLSLGGAIMQIAIMRPAMAHGSFIFGAKKEQDKW